MLLTSSPNNDGNNFISVSEILATKTFPRNYCKMYHSVSGTVYTTFYFLRNLQISPIS